MEYAPINEICRLQENRYYGIDDISRILHCSSDVASQFVGYMKKNEVCKTGQKNEVSFQFVGFIEFSFLSDVNVSDVERRVVFVEPKFFPNDRSVKNEGLDLAQIIVLKAILKYHKGQHISSFSNGRLTSCEGCTTRLSTFLALIVDIMEKGVYQVPKVEFVVNGQGDVDWEETLATVEPVFLQDGPCYMSSINREIGYDDDTYISRLHSCLATECFSYFEEIGLADSLGLYLETPYDGDQSDFGSESYQSFRIASELQSQFVDDKKHTLRLMQAVLENKAYGTDSLSFQSFGISGFHALWEKAIKEVLGDELEKTPDQLGIKLRETSKSKLHKPLKEFIEAPRWMMPENKNKENGLEAKCDEETDRLKPDFVAISKNEGRGVLYILDAKYYMPKSSDRSISGVPGVGDIDKQLLYQLAYQELISENNLVVENAFLFPMYIEPKLDSKNLSVKLFATVRVPILATALDKPEFRTYLLDGISLLRRYVYNEDDDANHGLLRATISSKDIEEDLDTTEWAKNTKDDN